MYSTFKESIVYPSPDALSFYVFNLVQTRFGPRNTIFKADPNIFRLFTNERKDFGRIQVNSVSTEGWGYYFSLKFPKKARNSSIKNVT